MGNQIHQKTVKFFIAREKSLENLTKKTQNNGKKKLKTISDNFQSIEMLQLT